MITALANHNPPTTQSVFNGQNQVHCPTFSLVREIVSDLHQNREEMHTDPAERQH